MEPSYKQAPTPPSKGKVLIVYYSRTGHTERVARMLAKATGGDLCAITEDRSRQGAWGYMRSVWQSTTGRQPAIHPLGRDPAIADLVLIGTPIWGRHLSSPVRSFAHGHRRQIKRVAYFSTQRGAGSAGAFDELRHILGRSPVATLSLSEADIGAGRAALQVKAFAHRVIARSVAAASSDRPEPSSMELASHPRAA
jgi:hypothetical protein